MAEFMDPFSGQTPERKLTKEELIRAIRLDIAAEYEAIHLYTAHAEAIDDPLAREVLLDIANEEREHVGEFQRLLEILTGDENEWVATGREEVNEMAASVGAATQSAGAAEAGDEVEANEVGEQPTIGSLKEESR